MRRPTVASIARPRWLPVYFAVLFCAGLVLVGLRSAASPLELLPDIDPKAPKGLEVGPDGSAAFDDVGSEPLRIEGAGDRTLRSDARWQIGSLPAPTARPS